MGFAVIQGNQGLPIKVRFKILDAMDLDWRSTFKHLLNSLRQAQKHKKFLNLVLRIGNEANDSWLEPTIQELMKKIGK